MVPLALNRAAKDVIQAEEGGAEEEESRGEIIVETESRIVYNCWPLLPGFEESNESWNNPKQLHDPTNQTGEISQGSSW